MQITVEDAAEYFAREQHPSGQGSRTHEGFEVSPALGESGAGGTAARPTSAGSDVAADSAAGVVVVSITGEIDLYTGPRLRERLSAVMAATSGDGTGQTSGLVVPATELSGADSHSSPDPAESAPAVRGVIIDLLQVTFMDSYGLGVLVWAHKAARSRGLLTALVADNPVHHKLFQVTGLGRVMPLHPDVATALQTLA